MSDVVAVTEKIATGFGVRNLASGIALKGKVAAREIGLDQSENVAVVVSECDSEFG